MLNCTVVRHNCCKENVGTNFQVSSSNIPYFGFSLFNVNHQENIGYEDACDASPTDGNAGESRKYVDQSLLQKIQVFEPVIENANEVGPRPFFF